VTDGTLVSDQDIQVYEKECKACHDCKQSEVDKWINSSHLSCVTRAVLFLGKAFKFPFSFSDLQAVCALHVRRCQSSHKIGVFRAFEPNAVCACVSQAKSKFVTVIWNKISHKLWVPSLGYMCSHICLSEGVHWRLAIEGKNILIYYLFANIIYIYRPQQTKFET